MAVDAETGQEVWKTLVGNINIGETLTMSPLVVKDKVLVGNSGGEYGVRGWGQALNTVDGKPVWKAYNTGPDKDVLIGPDFKPFYDSDKGTDLGVTTWPAGAWEHGGGTVWGWIAYDPELKSIYHGTANPGPWNHEQRPGTTNGPPAFSRAIPIRGEITVKALNCIACCALPQRGFVSARININSPAIVP